MASVLVGSSVHCRHGSSVCLNIVSLSVCFGRVVLLLMMLFLYLTVGWLIRVFDCFSLLFCVFEQTWLTVQYMEVSRSYADSAVFVTGLSRMVDILRIPPL